MSYAVFTFESANDDKMKWPEKAVKIERTARPPRTWKRFSCERKKEDYYATRLGNNITRNKG